MELVIKWQRLVDDRGQTCDRCTRTGGSIEAAVKILREALAPLGIIVVAETRTLAISEFMQAPLESNRVWIGGRSLEEWLGAEPGRSQCCGLCVGHECRTLYMNGQRYDIIPEELLLKAGLLAAAQLIVQPRTQTEPSNNRLHAAL